MDDSVESIEDSDDDNDNKKIQLEEALAYEAEIINDYNNSSERWHSLNEKILVVIKNDIETEMMIKKIKDKQKLYIQNLSHLSDLHRRLCGVLMHIEKRSTCWFYNEKRIAQCLKLKIPSKVLNYLFERFANRVNFENEDFRPKKDFSNQNESSTFENNNFVHFCIVVYSTLRDLYGDDSLKCENFKRSIEDLFSNKDKCPGFAKLVGKLSVLDNFCYCCNNIDDIKSDSHFVDEFFIFRDLMTQSSLRMVPDTANNTIKIEERKSKKEKDIVSITDINKNLNLKEECVPKLINTNSSNNKPPISLLKIFLLIGTIITFLLFLCFLLNVIFLFTSVITTSLSVILAITMFTLFLLQIFIAYKTDSIRLYKFCCCIKSDNKSLFNIRQNDRNSNIVIEDQNKNIFLFDK